MGSAPRKAFFADSFRRPDLSRRQRHSRYWKTPADGAVLFDKSPHPYCFTQVSYQAPRRSEGLFSEGAIFAPVASNTAISDLRRLAVYRVVRNGCPYHVARHSVASNRRTFCSYLTVTVLRCFWFRIETSFNFFQLTASYT